MGIFWWILHVGRVGKQIAVDLAGWHFFSFSMCRGFLEVLWLEFCTFSAWNWIASLVWLVSSSFSTFRWGWDVGRGESFLFPFATQSSLDEGWGWEFQAAVDWAGYSGLGGLEKPAAGRHQALPVLSAVCVWFSTTSSWNNRAVAQYCAPFSQSYSLSITWLTHINRSLDAAGVCSRWYVLFQYEGLHGGFHLFVSEMGSRVLEEPTQTPLNWLVQNNNCFWIFCLLKYFLPAALAVRDYGCTHFSKPQSEINSVCVTGIWKCHWC